MRQIDPSRITTSQCIDNDDWKAFLVNPFEANRLQKFTKKCLQSNEQRNDKQKVSPPYRITFKSITSDVRPISSGTQKLDVRHMNANETHHQHYLNAL
jgi:hypothetical protein